MSETLRQKQSRFALSAARLILRAEELGYEVTLGEAWRPPEIAAVYADQGKGIINSLHFSRLALDLNIFKNGIFQGTTEAHAPLGAYWKSLGPDHCWGGDFR